jgi:methyl-accepting chemotaxis protein
MSADRISRLTTQLHRQYLIGIAPFLAPVAFLDVCLLGLSDEARAAHFAFFVVAWLLSIGSVVGLLSYWQFRSMTRTALATKTGEKPGARLPRLLELPRRLEWRGGWLFVTGSALWMVLCGMRSGLTATGIVAVAALSLIVNSAYAAMAGVHHWMQFETALLPFTLEEHQRHPTLKPTTNAASTPRLEWFLPYVFAIFVISTVQSFALLAYANYSAVSDSTEDRLGEFMVRMKWPSLLIGAFLLLLAIITAVQLGRRYRRASQALQSSIEGLASTTPKLPDWVGTDEFGVLAFDIANIFERMNRLTVLLNRSASELSDAAGQLSGSTTVQNETLSRQAAALQETEVTAQEIKQTSLLAAQKTETVLRMAERAEVISQAGSAAVEQSLTGLTDIRDSVGEMSARIRELGDRARQIASITTTVKDLADQSNMLALNAAIEAVRSGEHGKGFAVVAREIRTLADQSIQATNQVREILRDISEAIRSTVAMTEHGSDRVQASLVQVQSSGESLRALSSIVRDNAAAVRQIAAAVGQQNSGITEIFEAVKDLSRMMDESLLRVQASDEASQRVREVAEQVTSVVGAHGPSDATLRPAEVSDAEAA